MTTRTKLQFCVILLSAEAAILTVRVFGIYTAVMISMIAIYLILQRIGGIL